MNWYIFNIEGENIGYCDNEPNHEDLTSRGEVAVFYEKKEAGELFLVGGEVVNVGVKPSDFHFLKKGKWSIKKEDNDAYISSLKRQKLNEINSEASRYIENISKSREVPSFARDTWAVQKQEAEAWAADNNAETPVLAAIALNRGVDLDDLRKSALAKSRKFAIATAVIEGQRQALVDLLEAAQTEMEIQKIQPVYSFKED